MPDNVQNRGTKFPAPPVENATVPAGTVAGAAPVSETVAVQDVVVFTATAAGSQLTDVEVGLTLATRKKFLLLIVC